MDPSVQQQGKHYDAERFAALSHLIYLIRLWAFPYQGVYQDWLPGSRNFSLALPLCDQTLWQARTFV